MQQRIVITGAPGTGKTSIIKKLENDDFFCYHEIIRNFTLEAKENSDTNIFDSNPLAFVKDPFEFNTKILNGRINQYLQSQQNNNRTIFFDRAIPDVLAYMDFFNQKYGSEFTGACRTYRYNNVFLLPPWEDIYMSDNERFESFEEAKQIHYHLEKTYRAYSYPIKLVPFGSVEERVNFILKQLNS